MKEEEGTPIDPRKEKWVEVKATEKHPGYAKNPIRKVPAHQIPNLVERGMIEAPNAKPKKQI